MNKTPVDRMTDVALNAIDERDKIIAELQEKLTAAEEQITVRDSVIANHCSEIQKVIRSRDEFRQQIVILRQALEKIAPHTIEFDGEEIPSEEAIIAIGAIGRYERLIIEQEAAKHSD
ncbi:MAG: hypothetical protein E6713_02890 [Sporomusaceae bacterium]|nr:hypothetical protein [Sporomusaceae bacterium]